jgi:hypothetical protein
MRALVLRASLEEHPNDDSENLESSGMLVH